MNRSQRVVLAVALLLIIVVFVFPFTRYMHVEPGAENARPPTKVGNLPEGTKLSNMKFSTRQGFRPFWQPADPLALERGSNLFGVGIRWPIVIAIAAGIVLIAGAAAFGLRVRRESNAPPVT